MQLDVREDRGVSIVALDGELDATTSGDLDRLIDRLCQEGRRQFVIDLERVGFVDSSGLATLVRAFKRVRGIGGRLHLAALQPSVRRVFDLTRLDRAFDIFPGREEATRRLSR